jgi:hypothetical protein
VGAGSGLVARHALAHIFEDRAQERGRFSIEHWRSPPAKAASCLNPTSLGFTEVMDDEKFCGRTEMIERGPAFWGLGLLRQRVKAAMQLMTVRGLPLSEIAIAVGFANQSHFTKVFSAQVGVNPAIWRRESLDIRENEK